MMSMSSIECSTYLHEELEAPLPPERISEEVVLRMESLYRDGLPLVDEAPAAVERIAAKRPTGPCLVGESLVDRSCPSTGTFAALLPYNGVLGGGAQG
jgi:hypothetical protein